MLFFAEIKLHPGASSSNDEHSNFIGGKLAIVALLYSLSSFPPSLLLAGLEEAARNVASRQGTWLTLLPQLLLLLLLASQRSTA